MAQESVREKEESSSRGGKAGPTFVRKAPASGSSPQCTPRVHGTEASPRRDGSEVGYVHGVQLESLGLFSCQKVQESWHVQIMHIQA